MTGMVGKMPASFKEFLQRWAISTVAVLVATHIIPGIEYLKWYDLLIATFVLGLLNTFVRPLMLLFSLPLLVLTLGLFTWVINALLLLFVSWLLGPAFVVSSFGNALLGALVISIITVALNALTKTGNVRVEVRKAGRDRRPPDDRPGGKGGGGPVIDV